MPKWRHISTACVPGELLLDEHREPELGRSVRIARFLLAQEAATPWPALHDAVVLQVGYDHLVLAGMEEQGAPGRFVYQSWVLYTQPPET